MGDTKAPILILLLLIVVVGFAYGPLKNASQKSKSDDRNTPSTIGAQANAGYTANKEIADSIKEVEKKIKNIDWDSDADENIQRSPYYDKVKMSNISGLNDSNPNNEFLTLSTSLKKTETIKITGWYLQSKVTGRLAVIGKAALLPFPYTRTESDVILQSGDRVILNKGFSPIGISFRTNKCTGYFAENRDFTPSLPLKCPVAKDENLPLFSTNESSNDRCVDAIKKIGRCKTKGSSFLRDLEDTVNQSCKNYIKNINYNSCVAWHYDDTDFPGNEYRIYFRSIGKLWRDRDDGDKIGLYDENGLVVDSISY